MKHIRAQLEVLNRPVRVDHEGKIVGIDGCEQPQAHEGKNILDYFSAEAQKKIRHAMESVGKRRKPRTFLVSSVRIQNKHFLKYCCLTPLKEDSPGIVLYLFLIPDRTAMEPTANIVSFSESQLKFFTDFLRQLCHQLNDRTTPLFSQLFLLMNKHTGTPGLQMVGRKVKFLFEDFRALPKTLLAFSETGKPESAFSDMTAALYDLLKRKTPVKTIEMHPAYEKKTNLIHGTSAEVTRIIDGSIQFLVNFSQTTSPIEIRAYPCGEKAGHVTLKLTCKPRHSFSQTPLSWQDHLSLLDLFTSMDRIRGYLKIDLSHYTLRLIFKRAPQVVASMEKKRPFVVTREPSVRVLLLEKNIHIGQSIVDILEKSTIDVHWCETIDDCLSWYQKSVEEKRPYQFVIVDQDFHPLQNDHCMVQAIKSLDSRCRVIRLTNSPWPISQGTFDHCLIKPFKEDELMTAIS